LKNLSAYKTLKKEVMMINLKINLRRLVIKQFYYKQVIIFILMYSQGAVLAACYNQFGLA